MAEVEHVVNIMGRETHIVGDDSDEYAKSLHGNVREMALEYAAATLSDDAVILDLGANVGTLAIGFSLIAPRGSIVAVEPSPTTYAYLTRNVHAAMVTNIKTVNVAVSEVPGTLDFFDCPWFSAGSFVRQDTIAAGVHNGSVTVAAETIDGLVDRLGVEHVDLIKIDIEGHELPALRGARETLRRWRPNAVIEMNLFATTSFGNTLPLDFLAEICSVFPYVYDYRFDIGLFPVANEDDMYGRVQSQFLTGRPTDLICRFDPLPAEVAELLTKSLLTEEPACTAGLPDARELEAENARLRNGLLQASSELGALRGSTSWKVTAPARWVSDRVARQAGRRRRTAN